MRKKGDKNKPRVYPRFKGAVPTYDEYYQMWVKKKMPSESVMMERYERMVVDIKKVTYRTWRKSNYDLFVHAGLIKKTKTKYKL